MPVIANLKEIVDALEMQNDDLHGYLNTVTGKVVLVSTMETYDEEEDDLQDWQQEEVRLQREVEESEDYLPLPSKFDIHEYRIMEDFCLSLQDQSTGQELLGQIRGSGAFRRFKNEIHRLGIEKDWYAFRDRALEQIAVDWLDANNIPYEKAA